MEDNIKNVTPEPEEPEALPVQEEIPVEQQGQEDRPVVVNILGVAGGVGNLIVDGMPIRNLLDLRTEHGSEGTVVTVQFRPEILVQELLTEDLFKQRVEEIQKQQQEAMAKQEKTGKNEFLDGGLPN